MNELAGTRRRRDLAAVLLALALPSVVTWIYFFRAASAEAGTQLIVFNVVKVIQFAFPVLWVVAVQRERPRFQLSTLAAADGISRGRGALLGIGFGLLVAATLFALYFGWLRGGEVLSGAAEEIIAKVRGWKIDSSAKFLALGVFYSLVHSFLEEYYWRWFVFGQLRRWIAFWPAAVVSALGFMAHHVLVLGHFFGFASPAAWFFSLCVAVGGLAWAWLYERTGSLVGPWLSHLMVDAAIFAVGYDLVSAGWV